MARRGYAVGSAVLAAVLPANQARPTAATPMAMDDTGLELADGIEAKQVILTQLAQALEVIREHDPARIVTLGGESRSVSPPSRHSPTATATTWPSSGSTPTLTSAPRPASIPGSTPWRSRR